ncbi:Aminopeptidase N [Roseimaritima ulvae]|uniref:Aminopeptidase N n=1 Tax=Roseimaritima ulvae TaxID=980254 RepID=A0A5B9QWL4_9BACT|nr:Aminopeptidase N [Roseimaritima ulvae]
MIFAKRFFATLVFFCPIVWASYTSPVQASEIICRYCAEGRAHAMPLGLDLDGRYHYAPDRQVDVLHIKLDVTPDFDKRTVAGTTSITATPIAEAVDILRLDAIDLDIKAIRCDGAKVLDHISSRSDLRIAFAEPIPVGQKFTVHIDYAAQPLAGLYFRTPEMGYPATDTHIWTQGETHEARHWFPCFDYPNERSSTEVICHVPKDMTVLSNGQRMGEEIDADGLKSVRWLQEKPHANYLICLVAGHLEKLEKQYRDIPLGFYTQPSLFPHAANSFRDTPQIMEFYEQEIGVDYPWVKYDQVTIRDFSAGGMENTTMTTLMHNTIFSEATENIRSSRSLDAHELAHQWFGDYVTCKDWSHLWLNEGFATYYTHLYEGHKYGRDALLYGLYRDATGRILTQDKDKKPIVYNGYKNAMEQFDYRSYPKGSWVLHMLRSQLGEDLYRQCIKAYLEKHALTSVVSDDLRQVIEDLSGRPMDRFFDQWVYHPRHPDLDIRYKWMPKQGLAKVTIKQTQPINDDVLLYRFPTRLRFVVDGKVIDHNIEVSKVEEDFYVPLDAQPTIVRFDPEYTVLAKVKFDKSNEQLKAQIENQDDMIGRLLACDLLASRKTHASVELLEKTLNEDPFYGVRIAAAKALAKHGSDEAYAVLKKSWASQQDAKVRLATVEPIVKRYHDDTPELIADVLETEKNPAIQAVAIRALGRFQSDATRQQLQRFLDTPSFNNELTVAAINAIGQLNDPAYTAPLMQVLEQRQAEFSARDFGTGLTTLAQLAKLADDKQAVRGFLTRFVNHPQQGVQTASIGALGKLGDPQALSVLKAFADSSDSRISKTANTAIGQLNEVKPTAPKELIELRKNLQAMKQESEKLEKKLDEIQKQLEAQK